MFSQQINLVLQLIILLVLIISVSSVKKRTINTHCNLMSIAFLLEIISVIMFMNLTQSPHAPLGQLLSISLWVHHLLGLSVLILIMFIILRTKNIIKIGSSYKFMRPVFTLWLIVLISGFVLYQKLHI